MKRIYLRKIKLLLTAVAAVMVLAMAVPAGAVLQAVGPVSGPHGFPLYYTDINNLSLELCLGDEELCFFDPVDPTNPNHVALGVGGEVFWWMAETEALGDNMDASLTLALEGTFGGDEEVVNGQQISFGRVRVRVDVPVAGTYVVTHPFGTLTFNNVTVADGINYTADIGAANFLDVEAAFAGALQSNIGPFLTWPDYQNEPTLQVNGFQYVGDNATPHVVVGSPIASTDPLSGSSGFQNFFRVVGPNGIVAETDLFVVMGRVYGGQPAIPHVYPPPPEPILKDVGPINRLEPFNSESTAELVNDGLTIGYPLGYPIWYQDYNNLQLTICQGGTEDDPDPMCISDPIDETDPDQVALHTGGETFWWSGDAFIDEDSPTDDTTFVGTLPPPLLDDRGRVDVDFDALLVLGLEGTFGGDEAIVDGNQISFGRTRIRIDTTFAGTYTVIYPYGFKRFVNVPAGRRAIDFTADIGITDPGDPDSAFVGALFSEIGPYFLTWDTFDPTLLGNDPLLIKPQQAFFPDGSPVLDGNGDPVFNMVHYVGDPAIPHLVTGSEFFFTLDEDPEEPQEPVNYFRVIGVDPTNPANDFDVRTYLFNISGQVYSPITFRGGIIAAQNTPPVVTAPDPITVTAPAGAISVPASDPVIAAFLAEATATDVEDGNLTNDITHDAPDNFPLGTTIVTFSVTDSGGLTGKDTSTVTILAEGGNNAPVVTPPDPITVTALLCATSVPASHPEIEAFLKGATATDAEGNSLTVTNDAPLEFPLGSTTVIFSATANGLTGTAISTVTVIETPNTAPDVTAPDPIIIESATPVPATDLRIQAFLDAATADDVEDGPLSVTNNAPDPFPLGTTTVTFSATDSCGVTTIVTSTVTVNAPPPPPVVLTIQQFKASNQVRLARNENVTFSVRVRNNDRNFPGTASAKLVGVQNDIEIYTQTNPVTVPARSTVDVAFPAYTPTVLGDITWTLTLEGEGQGATATATTRVR